MTIRWLSRLLHREPPLVRSAERLAQRRAAPEASALEETRTMTLNEPAIRHFAAFLSEKLHPELWDFKMVRGWYGPGERPVYDAATTELLARNEPCGAVACAIGLAPVVFPSLGHHPGVGDVAAILGMPVEDADCIFGGTVYLHRQFMSDVTPHDVAAALLRYIDEGAWWREEDSRE